MWQSRTKTQVNRARKYLVALGMASDISWQNLSIELLKYQSKVSQRQEPLKFCYGAPFLEELTAVSENCRPEFFSAVDP